MTQISQKRQCVFIVAGIVILIALAVGIGIYNTPANRLKRQFDLGNRYLEEMNYEQAVIAFESAIEIDPISVDAYLGLAEAYVGKDDYESAIDALQRGYELTGDEEIKIRLDELTLRMDGVNQKDKMKEQRDESVLEVVSNEKSDDGKWKNPKMEIGDEDKDFVRKVVSLCEAYQYEEAAEILRTDEFIGMLNKYEIKDEYHNYFLPSHINTIIDNYIIYAFTSKFVSGAQSGTSTRFIYLPENGNGYILGRDYINDTVDDWQYLICPVEKYNFNGKFYSYHVDRKRRLENHEEVGEGHLSNNYYDGKIIIAGDKCTETFMYDNGYRQTFGEYDDSSFIISQIQRGTESACRRMDKSYYYEKFANTQYGPLDVTMTMFADFAPWE
ncbi:MAG: tetratricopeptide repeat protein [Lachnospiraceae bacterium]|nr:tetratricopeptide repeat protein [Lachnospiraceae bacterium]